ncbi:MAG: tRNA epoxyqueuosine(34) reductase QueG [Sedimentisphaerales bacterium]|jgi:epoxyqueuosine reductase|nr:tRNA epoxyqueuosine(34) reductase QueG [Sedimentisphaerales bacterium]
MGLKELIKAKAIELGLDAVGVAPAKIGPHEAERLMAWIGRNRLECLSFIGRGLKARLDPCVLLPGASSVIVVGLAFKPQALPAKPTGLFEGRVAIYALYQDYHKVLKQALRQLATFMLEVAGRPGKFKLCVDSSAVMERTMAVQAGLGFICRNYMLANPLLGPAIFLGEIITDLKLEPDPPAGGKCLGCMRCVSACPTGAIQADGFYATRCINTWTIEHNGPLPTEIATAMADRLYGCDDCITACPLYQKAPASHGQLLKPVYGRRWIDLDYVLGMTSEQFEQLAAGSVIHRIGLDRLRRNAMACLQNMRGGKGPA